MRKRISAMLLTVLLALSMILPVSAKNDVLYIIDQRSCITAFIPEFNAKASAISDTYGINVTCLLTETTGGMGTPAYSEQIYKACFGEEDGIMLIESSGEAEWYLYKSGAAVDLFTVEDEDALGTAFVSRGYYDDAVEDYLDEAHRLLEAKTGIVMDEAALDAKIAAAEEASEAEEVTTTEAEGTEEGIPEERLRMRLEDEADLLTEEEEADLLSKLDEISERQECDVVVLTVDSLNGRLAEEYADDFYDYNGYGYGESRDGILLLISMEEHDWVISNCGFGITAFTDAGQEYMTDKFVPMLSDGEYQEAFTEYARLCDEFITQAKTGEPYDSGNLPKGSVSPIWIVGDILIGLVIAFIIGSVMKSKLKSVIKQETAEDYAVPGSMVLTANWDHLVNKTVTTRRIERERSSSGSSTHSSSSGTSHGGSKGKF